MGILISMKGFVALGIAVLERFMRMFEMKNRKYLH